MDHNQQTSSKDLKFLIKNRTVQSVLQNSAIYSAHWVSKSDLVISLHNQEFFYGCLNKEAYVGLSIYVWTGNKKVGLNGIHMRWNRSLNTLLTCLCGVHQKFKLNIKQWGLIYDQHEVQTDRFSGRLCNNFQSSLSRPRDIFCQINLINDSPTSRNATKCLFNILLGMPCVCRVSVTDMPRPNHCNCSWDNHIVYPWDWLYYIIECSITWIFCKFRRENDRRRVRAAIPGSWRCTG